MASDASGSYYVADTDNNRIQKFTSTGAFLAKWGSGGNGDGQFRKAYGAALDGSSHLYVADTLNSRLQVFSTL